MKNQKNLVTLLLSVTLVLGIASTAISTVAYGSFAYFEIFYFICMVTGLALVITSNANAKHLSGGIALFWLGFFVNSFIWSNGMTGIAQIFNYVMTAMLFVYGFIYLHGLLNVKWAQKISFIYAIMLSLVIFAIAVYNLIINVSGASPLFIACYVIQNLSLISTICVIACQYIISKNN